MAGMVKIGIYCQWLLLLILLAAFLQYAIEPRHSDGRDIHHRRDANSRLTSSHEESNSITNIQHQITPPILGVFNYSIAHYIAINKLILIILIDRINLILIWISN